MKVIAPVFSALLLQAAAVAAEKVDFNRDVQPILAENCYHCHGPDAKAREADLRLDQKEGAYRSLDGITVVKPGDSNASELVTRIFTTDRDEVMPPPKSHRTLTSAQKELLKRWVDEGAEWGQHWAFVAPKRPPVPAAPERESRLTELETKDAPAGAELRKKQGTLERWPQNAIDHFILDRLLLEGLAPSPQASPEKLCRRLFLDLTGLPPTPQEVDAFVAESARDPQSATRALVDRLLASPRYGERMVWEWLDAARYADTNGYQGDPTRAMWYWRDWAIKALNDNMPFDQFTREQLAGDLFPNPTREQLIATGFHRNHMINGEGGRIAEESRVEYVQDRVETTGTVWMGLTLNCCRCHDHKFDPISQSEYYQLSAYFNSIDESGGGGNDGQGLANPTFSLGTPEQQKKVEALKAAEQELERERSELEKKLRGEQPKWEEALLAGHSPSEKLEAKWHVLVPDEVFSDAGAMVTKSADGTVLVSGKNPPKDSFVVTVQTKLQGITGFKLEALPDASLPGSGPGRAENGNFVLSEVKLQGSGKPVELAGVSATFEQGPDHKEHTSFDNNPETGWALMPQLGKPQTLIFEARSQVGYGGDTLLSFRLECQSGHISHVLGKFRLSATTDNAALLRPMPENIRNIIAVAVEKRTEAQMKELAEYFLSTHPAVAAAKQKREEAKKARETAERQMPRTMVMRERAKPRDTFILEKGAYDKYGPKVEHGTPSVLPPLKKDAPKNRVALAEWLVAPEHPLTARVTVNRVWQTLFGTGLVKTAEDFGVQGEKPSHPELLDWLALEFVESGWDMKHLVRLIVTSATYQQSSKIPPGMAERDPENRLLSRGARFRLPSWMLRDQALAVSGLIVEKVGGPPVKTYQPAGVWEDATFGQIRYSQDHGEALYRRSLYVFWRRIVQPTLFFDVANRQNCSVKTGRTNTPLHALVTMNDVTFVEAARALAERMLLAPIQDDGARISEIFRRCTARPATSPEIELLTARLGTLRANYEHDKAAAARLIATGESKPNPALHVPDLAAWTAVALLALNMDETLSKE